MKEIIWKQNWVDRMQLCKCEITFNNNIIQYTTNTHEGPSWSWSYGSWIYNCAISAYHHYGCEFVACSWRGVLDATLCDEVCQWLAAGWWFSPGSPVSSTNKTDSHDIHEILLKVVLNTITLTLTQYYIMTSFKRFESKPVVKRIFIYDRLGHR